MDLRSHQRNVNYLGRNYNIWATQFYGGQEGLHQAIKK